MTEVREAELETFDAVHDDLLTTLNPRIPRERWLRLFEHRWRMEGVPPGYVLWSDGRPVGFLGLLFAVPAPGDGGSPVCNVTSWIVLDAYRGMSLRLVAPVLARTDWTVLNLTPTREVHGIFTALGFQELETERCLLPLRPDRLLPLPGPVQVDPVVPGEAEALPALEREIVLHHGPLVQYLRVRRESASCLLVYGTGTVRGVPSARIHHVTDRRLAREALGPVQRALFKRHRACFMEFDARIMGAGLPWGTVRRTLPVPRLFRSPDRAPEELTDLFTEMILLDL